MDRQQPFSPSSDRQQLSNQPSSPVQIISESEAEQVSSEKALSKHTSNTNEVLLLKAEKQHFISQLLKRLGFQDTLKNFENECKGAKGDKNPEQASNKKKIANQKKKQIGQDYYLKQVIQNSQSYDAMLSALEAIYNTNYSINYDHIEQTMQQIAINIDFQRHLKPLFPSKEEAIVPKTRSIQILLKQKEVIFIDVNEQEKICLLDNEDYLHIISSSGVSKPLKVEDGKDVAYLKWINKSVIFSVSYSGKVTVFLYQGNEVRMRESIPLKMPKIKRINLHILKYPERPEKEYVRILLKNEHSQFIACQVVVEKTQIKFTGGTLFQTNHSFKAFNIIRTRKTDIEEIGEGFPDVEHYYGLADSSRHIIKFDTVVKKEGVLWTSDRKIDSMNNSKCRYFLILLLVASKERRRKARDDYETKKPRTEIVFQYEFLRMNGHGCIIERVPLDLQSPFLPNGLQSVGFARMRRMDPEWLVCFDWQDSIVYASSKTGKILHVENLEEQVKLIGVGASNCIICSAEEKIFVMSVHQGQKKRVILQKRPQIRDRQSLILRLTRNGMPETLLQLLQELRNNQVEIIEP